MDIGSLCCTNVQHESLDKGDHASVIACGMVAAPTLPGYLASLACVQFNPHVLHQPILIMLCLFV
jgi:hypothetical protein